VHDMIGAAGMVQGWCVLWHAALLWLIPILAVALATTWPVEVLVSAGRIYLYRSVQSLPSVRQGVVVGEMPVVLAHPAFATSPAPADIISHGAD
jgi:hypothetical protein